MTPIHHSTETSLYHEILTKLDRLRAKENREKLFSSVLLFLIGLIAILLTTLMLEALFHFGVGGRTVFFWLIVAVSALGFGWFVALPVMKLARVLPSSGNESLARKAGEHFAGIKDRLLNLLQLHREKTEARTFYSLELIDAAFEDLRNDISQLDFAEAVTYERPKKYGRSTLLLAALSLVLLLSFRSPLSDAANRLAHFRQEFVSPPSVRFSISPGNVQVVRGENVRVEIGVDGTPVENIAFLARSEGEIDFNRALLKKNRDEKFSYEFDGIKHTTQYRAEAEGIESDEYKITVLDRPVVKNLRLRLTPPSYTNIPPRDLEDNVGDATALVGTKIDVEVRSNKEPTKASLVFSDKSHSPMKIAGLAATTRIVLSKDVSYRILLIDEKKIENRDPIEYQLKVVQDEDPTVAIVLPGKDVDLANERSLPLLLRIHDDFGFTRLRLGYKLVYSRYERPHENYSFTDLPIEKPGSRATVEMDIPYLWDLKRLNLATDDVVSYFAEVYDNDAVSGPKAGRSQSYTIRVPSLAEILAGVEKTHEQTIGDLKEATESAKDLKKQLDEINQDLKKSKEQLNWEKQKKNEELVKKYEQLQKNIQEASRKLEEAINQLETNRLISPETMEKYFELQKLFEQINSPELREAMKKLQEAMRNLNPDQLREAMQKFTFSEEMFRQSLERTLSLLKRIQIEQKLEEMIKRTNELQQRQENLRAETQKSSPGHHDKQRELSQRQRDAQKDLQSLEKDLSGLEQKMQEFPDDMPLDELRKAMDELAKQRTEEKMGQSADEIQSGRMQSASQKQRQASASLEQLMKQLEQAQQSMLQKQQQQVVRDLKKMMQDLLELSKQQETLKQQSQELEPNSQQFREKAQEQTRLRSDLMNLIDSMMKLSQKTFGVTREMGRSMGKALTEMNEAMEGIESRNGTMASRHQGEAMGALNEAATQVMNSLQMMMKGGGGGLQSLLQQLRMMIGQQQGINAGTMSLGDMNAMTPQQQAEMARLAAEQGAVQKSLQQLNEEARQSAERERILGDLGKISEEMREVVRDLEQRDVNPNTIKRQERILSRLLDAQRSARERDFEKRRKAETGKEVVRTGPQELDLTTKEGKDRLMQDLLKAMEEGYAKDYEELIRRYFEALQKLEVQRAEK